MTDENACFSRHVRLLKPDEFSRVFKNPVRSSDRYLTILAVAREGADVEISGLKISDQISSPRLGLAISKKNAKRAVDRNRIKRLIRESFRQNLHALPSIDLVVMAKPIAKKAENQQIFQSLEQHWNKLARNFETQSVQK
ncbi:MAG: ribonuclease P protein component [endosymbiont of Galathealinum brachiosum]|uniref:Ribonuclease P protein component n=1 Tax=endosymbiont of Galathealinum brachiosum TaxID=2200906 RepID=A0A370DCT0_9GAMM|nr:MAG: ribonuclease P protein component [endosymbiont of Galathealinum brachiosum]